MTSNRRLIPALALVLVGVSISGCDSPGFLHHSWEIGGSVKVRIEDRGSTALIGAPDEFYLFSARRPSDGERRTFMTVRRGPGAPPAHAVGEVDENITFVHLDRQFAVTTDRGETWSLFDTSQVGRCRFGRIEEVLLKTDGTGVMTLRCPSVTAQTQLLRTSDFGASWSLLPSDG